jgi:hypothetical protein
MTDALQWRPATGTEPRHAAEEQEMDELDAFMQDLADWNNGDTEEAHRDVRVVLVSNRPDGTTIYYAGVTRRETKPYRGQAGRYHFTSYGARYVDSTPADRPFAGAAHRPASFAWVNGLDGVLAWYDAAGKEQEGATAITGLALTNGVLVGTGREADGAASTCVVSFQKGQWPGLA